MLGRIVLRPVTRAGEALSVIALNANVNFSTEVIRSDVTGLRITIRGVFSDGRDQVAATGSHIVGWVGSADAAFPEEGSMSKILVTRIHG